MSDVSTIFDTLMTTIKDRRDNPSQKSYTNSLMQGGVDKIGKKIIEEADEVVQAATEPDQAGRDHLIHEAADLIYHLFVMLGRRNIELDEVRQELHRRFGQSGLDEKASRTTK